MRQKEKMSAVENFWSFFSVGYMAHPREGLSNDQLELE